MSYPQNTPPDVPGYELIRLIGLGGMGEVYLAQQIALNRPVAIKFLSRTMNDSTLEYDQRFRREAELMARVSHPNVVTIFDFGNAEGRPYLVMEYIEDGDLRSRMVPDQPMKVEEIRSIIRPVIRAMEYLHRQGIVHRDMKPENILVHHEETPKVTDFGLAVLDFAIGSLTRTGRAMGTPGYISPEQQYGLKLDERADQFSMAALCYELATGRKPLGAYPPPRKLNPKIGSVANSVILRGLSQDPDDRYPSIGEFGEALDQALARAGGSIGDRPFLGRLARRDILLGSLAALLGAAGLGLRNYLVTPDRTSNLIPTRLVARLVNLGLVLIPAGEFLMGSPTTDNDARGEEKPQHLVKITRPFYMAEKEVTLGQFRAFVKARDYRTVAESSGQGGCVFNGQTRKFERKPEYNWRNPRAQPMTRSEDEPVIQVCWEDAVAFCEWLSNIENRPYRLPTEAEWEYACRAGTTTRWSSGDDPESIRHVAWTLFDANNVFHPVGLKAPNRWGLFDMHGNAWEWCSDRFGEYDSAPATDPSGPLIGSDRVLRGGSFDWDTVARTRSASRYPFSQNMSFLNYGFRVCSPVP